MNAHDDLTAALPHVPFEFGAAAHAEAAELLAGPPEAVFRRLLDDQESETGLAVARHVLAAFLDEGGPAEPATVSGLIALIGAARTELGSLLVELADEDGEVGEQVLRGRAPLALLAGCWLDTLSQPATQPAVLVNRLFAHHFELKGRGRLQHARYELRRGRLAARGVTLPDVEEADFLRRAEARPLTVLHGAFYLALSRLPASFLPELVGVHVAFHLLGVDDLLLGTQPALADDELRGLLAEFFELTEGSPDAPRDRLRLARAVRLVVRLEREQVAMLVEREERRRGLSLDARVAEIVERHRPFAGRQHRNVRIGGRLLSQALADQDFDPAAFVQEFRQSRQLRPLRNGGCPFTRAIKFGGPMFGIFDEHEAAVFKDWAAAVAAGEPAGPGFAPDGSGQAPDEYWQRALAAARPADVLVVEPAPCDDRQLFHRLVNIESYPNTLPAARRIALAGLDRAELLFTHGAAGRYTDAGWFEYSEQALLERVDRIYWDKLVEPYRPLQEIPERDEVIFQQKTFALGSLIDGTWAHRIGNLGRYHRQSDAMLFSIYADEMGRGETAKNHITLIRRVLASMDVQLPHIRSTDFLDQGELPDGLYGFSIHQLCLSLFPDSLYNEILGYNLGIEMFGLGELRLHEIQKLRRYNLDASYEEAHLSIDNASAGHARQSAEIVVSYLDGVRRSGGEQAVRQEWRRIWRGYASFAWFVEHQLVRQLSAPAEHAALVL